MDDDWTDGDMDELRKMADICADNGSWQEEGCIILAIERIEFLTLEVERLEKICKENDYGSRLDESKTISGKTSTRCLQTLGRKP